MKLCKSLFPEVWVGGGRGREEGKECGGGFSEGHEAPSGAELSANSEGQGSCKGPKSKPGLEAPGRLSVVTPAGHPEGPRRARQSRSYPLARERKILCLSRAYWLAGRTPTEKAGWMKNRVRHRCVSTSPRATTVAASVPRGLWIS